jgi:Flp pilus assembly protein TadG
MTRRPTCRMAALLRDTRGTPAIEFAILAPVFLAMMVGSIYLCMLMFVTGSLQYAVEAAARCASVNTTMCPDNTSTVSFAQSHFYGSAILTPTFTYSATGCGHSVAATARYNFDLGLSSLTVPVSATSCFP